MDKERRRHKLPKEILQMRNEYGREFHERVGTLELVEQYRETLPFPTHVSFVEGVFEHKQKRHRKKSFWLSGYRIEVASDSRFYDAVLIGIAHADDRGFFDNGDDCFHIGVGRGKAKSWEQATAFAAIRILERANTSSLNGPFPVWGVSASQFYNEGFISSSRRQLMEIIELYPRSVPEPTAAGRPAVR